MNCTIQQTDGGEPFQLPPFAASILSVQSRHISDSRAGRNGLRVPDVSYDLKVHEESGALLVVAQQVLCRFRITPLDGMLSRSTRHPPTGEGRLHRRR